MEQVERMEFLTEKINPFKQTIFSGNFAVGNQTQYMYSIYFLFETIPEIPM
jgi:hypothetical protein